MTGRIAGAPISWGVCEVPGWGYQLRPDRVLAEMRQVGLAATELGPLGFLPSDPDRAAEVLGRHHLASVGGFTPVVLHVPGHDPLPEIERILAGYADTSSTVLVLSADSGQAGYDTRLVLDGSSIALCLDTGHLLIGGTDPAALARQAPDRIAHTHLKDVDDRMAAQVRSGRLTYTEAVRGGMYRPLGTGDVDVETIVSALGQHGYDGWYVLEQDTILTEEPHGEGPVRDVRTSADYVRSVLARS